MDGISAALTCDYAFIETNTETQQRNSDCRGATNRIGAKALAIEKKHLNYPLRRDVKTLIQIVAQLSFRLSRYSSLAVGKRASKGTPVALGPDL